MKTSPTLLIFSRSFIESGLANVNQTLYMAQNLAKFGPVHVYMRSHKRNDSDAVVKKIIGTDNKFTFKAGHSSAVLFTILFCLSLLTKKPSSHRIYTRSIIVGFFSWLLGYKSVVELHQDKFVNLGICDRAFGFICANTAVTRRLKIVVISQSLKDILLTKYGKIDNISVLHDAAEPAIDEFQNLSKRERPLAVYTGKLSNERSVDDIVKMAADFPDVDFCLVGGNANQVRFYRNMALEFGLKNVKVHLRQGFKRISYFQNKADILLAFWSHDVPTMAYCSPLKLFEYMQTGNKILVHDFPVLREVLPASPFVQYAEPGDLVSCKKAFQLLLNNVESAQTAREELRAHGMKYTYHGRARTLLDIIL